MNDYCLGKLLLEMKKNYVDQPVFQLVKTEDKLCNIMYSDFLSDLCINVDKVTQFNAKRIAIIGHNSYEWIINTLSLLLAGKTLILMNPDLDDEDILHLLEYADAECAFLPQNMQEEFRFIEKRIRTEYFGDREETKKNIIGEEKMLAQLPIKESEFLCFTSGTSKSSKGVVINTEMLMKHVLLVQKEAILPFRSKERIFMPLPLYHIYGLTFLFHIMAMGSTFCLVDSPRHLVRDAALMKPHCALLVPSMIEVLFRRSDLMPELHTVISGGGSCRKEQADLVRSKNVNFLNGYGSSESIAMVLLGKSNMDEQWMKPLSCVQCEVSNEGELLICSPYHFKEYYKKPEDTRLTLEGDIIHTGDAACMNEQGFVRIMGRLRDTIVMENGEKIHAEDMDSMLTSLEGVQEAAIVYSSKLGLTAVIVPESMGQEERIREKIALYNKNTGFLLRIRHIWCRIEKLPRTTTGKLKRFQLEKEYELLMEGRTFEKKR